MTNSWTRKGECNGCGHCCQHFGQDVAAFKLGAEADVEFFKVRGFQLFKDGADRIVAATKLCDLSSPCRHHDAEKKACEIYDTRPATCVDFPQQPEQIQYTPCSYWFENEEGQKIGGQGSPHPVAMPVFRPG
jgi:Fe-S-cluster containining protein